MSIRSFTGTASVLLLGLTSLAAASDNIRIPAGTTHDGHLETRNGSIHVEDKATIEGSLDSRNGRIETGSSVSAGDVRTRNGAIELGGDGRYGRIESRNGRIQLGDGSSVEAIESRNGSIRIGASSRTAALDSRNGGIAIGADAVVDGAVSTRNGSVSMASGSRVTGRITTRNGGVMLDGATAERGIQTLAGDIILDNASRSGGDLLIEITEENAGRNGGFFGFGGSTSWPEAGDIRILAGSEVDGSVILLLAADYDEELPVVEIASGSVVSGDVRVDSRVELIVEGEIGGEVERVVP